MDGCMYVMHTCKYICMNIFPAFKMLHLHPPPPPPPPFPTTTTHHPSAVTPVDIRPTGPVHSSHPKGDTFGLPDASIIFGMNESNLCWRAVRSRQYHALVSAAPIRTPAGPRGSGRGWMPGCLLRYVCEIETRGVRVCIALHCIACKQAWVRYPVLLPRIARKGERGEQHLR